MKLHRKFLALCLVLLSVSVLHAQQFRAALPSAITNFSPERFCGNVRSFTNSKTFSCYVHIIKSEAGNVVIDPGYYDGDLKDYIQSIGGVDVILLTHCHVDHIVGLNALMKAYPDAKACIHKSDLAGHNVKVISSLGHSPGSSLFYFEDEGLLFVGDTIALWGIPSHDLLNSNVPALFESLTRLKKFDAPAETEIFFGHGERVTFGEMLKNFDMFNKPLIMSIKTHDGKISSVKDCYFDCDVVMIALNQFADVHTQKISPLPTTNAQGESIAQASIIAYLPDMSSLKVTPGISHAEFNSFTVDMKAPAQL